MVLKEWENSDDLEFKAMASHMRDKYDKCWGDIEKMNMMIYLGAILDPSVKLEAVQLTLHDMYGLAKGEALATKVKEFVYDLFEEYRTLYAPLPLQSGESSNDSTTSVVSSEGGSMQLKRKVCERIKMRMRGHDGGSRFLRTELDRYLDEQKGEYEENDVLAWWKLNEPRFPILARMARDVLAIPVSTVASESAFSAGGRHLDPFRSSLTPMICKMRTSSRRT